jgi:hypothetical protein
MTPHRVVTTRVFTSYTWKRALPFCNLKVSLSLGRVLVGFVDGVHLPTKFKQNIPERYDGRRTGTVCEDWIPEMHDHDKNGQTLHDVPFKPGTRTEASQKRPSPNRESPEHHRCRSSRVAPHKAAREGEIQSGAPAKVETKERALPGLGVLTQRRHLWCVLCARKCTCSKLGWSSGMILA